MVEGMGTRARWNRRQFLAATAQAVTGASLGGGGITAPRAAPGQTAASGGGTVVDTHTHFYDPSRPEGVPWPPRDEKRLYRTVLPKDYRALPVPRPVIGTVVVEASPWVEDNRWVLDLAAHDAFIVGLVGNLPVGSKPFAGHLKRFATNQVFRGIRIRDRKLEGTWDDHAFASDLRLLADHDLSLDLVGGSEVLAFAHRLATELSGLRIVIDHLAGVRVDGRAPTADWVQKMKALVPRRNVYFKVSGLVEGTGRSDGTAPGDVEFYRPVLDSMWRMFGPERLMYASNWPVSELFAPLATVQGIVEEYFRSHGQRAQEQVFSLSGKAAYRWVQRESPR